MPDPEIDVDALMATIRAEVARRRGGAASAENQTAPPVSPSTEPVALIPAAPQLRVMLDQAQRLARVGTTVPPFTIFGPVRRLLARFVTRILYYVLQVITVDQGVFNGLLLNALRNVSNGLQESESGLAVRFNGLQSALAERDQRLAQLEGTITVLADRDQRLEAALNESVLRLARFETALRERNELENTLHAGFETALSSHIERVDCAFRKHEQRLAQFDAALAESARGVSYLKTGLVLQENRVGILLQEARQRLPEPFDQRQLQVLVEEERHMLDAMYVSLEDQFRGTRDDIKNRQRVYLPLVREATAGAADSPILDLGCGRGEWLELLKDQGLVARGVDANRIMIQQCRNSGLDVVEGDAIAYLQSLADGSLGAVTAFHLIEHLPHDVLIALLTETARVLKAGGMAIFETPNPQNVLVGSCTFYIDPTHHHPLPSSLVKFLAEARGLCRVEVIPLHPHDEGLRVSGSDVAERFNEYFYGPQDYGVIGWKA